MQQVYKISLIIINLIMMSAFSSPSYSLTQPIRIHILAVNDFHGQINTGQMIDQRPVGSAPVLAAYLKAKQKGLEDSTLLAFIGDQISGSPPESALLRDEPAVLFMNTLGNTYCTQATRMSPQCNMVATIGNHEFDKTPENMLEMFNGRDQAPTDHWIDLPKYPGANFPLISTNIVDATTGQLLFPPYVIKQVKGVSIAFIGAILKNAPDVILPRNLTNIKFLDEANSINHYIPEILAKNVHVIVVLLHQGGKQTPYTGPTQEKNPVEGAIVDVVNRLDDHVDLVLSAHTHNFTNAYLYNQHGKKILVTQALSYSKAFADVTLDIDPQTQSVLHESAEIITTYADEWPGTQPDSEAQRLTALAENKTAATTKSMVGQLNQDLLRQTNEAGESNIGDVIADAAKLTMSAEIGLYQPAGIRADIYAGNGNVSWESVYAVAPFGNPMVKMEMKGQDIYDLLEQQWSLPRPLILSISGIRYSYDLSQPLGHRVLSITFNGQPLMRENTYTVGTVLFLGLGGDGFSVMKRGKILDYGPAEHESLLNYFKNQTGPLSAQIDGRINKL